MLMEHCEPASRAQLRSFSRHAGGNFCHVRDKVRTKPHGVAGARLPCFVAGLSGGARDANNANPNNTKTYRQCRSAKKTQKTLHLLFSPGSVRVLFPRRGTLKHDPENASPGFGRTKARSWRQFVQRRKRSRLAVDGTIESRGCDL
jgi:hypothetical protein